MGSPFGSPLNGARYEYDPYLNADKLAILESVYISAGTGFTPSHYVACDLMSAPYEWGVLASSLALYMKTQALEITHVTLDVYPEGSHTYRVAWYALQRSLPIILKN